VRFTLIALPFMVHVETSPPGAKLSIGAKRGTAPGDIVLGPAFRGMLGVTARLTGYETGHHSLRAEDFTQNADNMVANVNLTLTPLPPAPVAPVVKPKPRVVPAPAPAPTPEAAPKEPEPAHDAAPAPPAAAEKPAEPAPAPAPTPTPDKLPANPFNE
jgi:outer membrane biosynthesis protein TonB